MRYVSFMERKSTSEKKTCLKNVFDIIVERIHCVNIIYGRFTSLKCYCVTRPWRSTFTSMFCPICHDASDNCKVYTQRLA